MNKTIWLLLPPILFVFVVYGFCGEIHEAVKRGDLAATRILLEKKPERINESDPYTLSPLHYAARGGHLELIELLLAKGAEINRKTRLEQSPLHLALAHGQQEAANLLIEKGAEQTPWKWPRIAGEYVGEEKPGVSPKLFSPLILSSIYFDHCAPAFTADGKEVFWSVVNPDETGFILGMKRVNDLWTRLEVLPFSQQRFRDINPTLSADGNTLYFTSCRPIKDEGKIGDFNMWRVERKGDTWSKPRLLAPNIASGRDVRPFFLPDGSMYFGSWRSGSINGSNIYRSQRGERGFAVPERVDASFNTDNAVPTWVAADESCLIFESNRPGGFGGFDFWISFKERSGAWGDAINLGNAVNTSGNDWLGGFSPDGKYFFFVSDRNGNNDIYWIDAGVIEKWKMKQ